MKLKILNLKSINSYYLILNVLKEKRFLIPILIFQYLVQYLVD